MSLSGYADRGADIRGVGRDKADDGLPYALLSYANGPSFYKHYHSMFYRISDQLSMSRWSSGLRLSHECQQ